MNVGQAVSTLALRWNPWLDYSFAHLFKLKPKSAQIQSFHLVNSPCCYNAKSPFTRQYSHSLSHYHMVLASYEKRTIVVSLSQTLLIRDKRPFRKEVRLFLIDKRPVTKGTRDQDNSPLNTILENIQVPK